MFVQTEPALVIDMSFDHPKRKRDINSIHSTPADSILKPLKCIKAPS